MVALSVKKITKTYGIHTILSGVALLVNSGQRVGLVGPNGVGKSTLLKIIAGEIEADGGSVIIPAAFRLGYLPQTPPERPGQTLAQLIEESQRHLITLESRLRELEQAMTTTSGDALDSVMDEYGEASEQFERYGGYEMAYRVDAVLAGLGVGHIPRERLFSTLSGGEKARVGLGLLLLQSPDVLLLDEPTNHLDFARLLWLEGYLRGYRGAILMVSHDRQFLNRTVTTIVEINEHTRGAKKYTGDYDAYLAAKALERRKWEADFAKQQEEIKQLHIAIKETARRNDNFRTAKDGDKFIIFAKRSQHQATVAKRIHTAEERLKRIEADPVPRPPVPLQFNADFDPKALGSSLPLYVSRLSKAFGDKVIVEDVSFSVDPHSRIALVGPNGTGKSTLLKLLLGLEAPDSGEVMLNPAATVGYLAQEDTSAHPQATVLEAYRDGLDGTEQQHKATLIHLGLFRYDELEKRVGELSSGQRRKLQIARLIAQGANLLVLDEPTNYVSFDVLEELEDALRTFPGPVIAASHDRRFLQQFGGEIWELRDGQIIDRPAEFSSEVAALLPEEEYPV